VPFTKHQIGLDVRLRFLSCTAQRLAKARIPVAGKGKKDANSGAVKGPAATPKSPRKPPVVVEPVEVPEEDLPWDALSAEDIKGIFGDGVSQSDGNGVLYELHDRRLSGSLSEYGISFQESVGVTEAQAMAGLEWLRREYPIDEAGAALEYAESAERGLQGEQLEQAVKYRLYKEDQPGESVYGHSVVQEKAKEWQESYMEKQRQKEILREERRKERAARTAEVRKEVEEKRLAIGQQHIELGEYKSTCLL
jgi:rhomboid-like protein